MTKVIRKIKRTPEGVVIYCPEKYTTLRLTQKEAAKMLGISQFPKDATPEVVHLEISDTCNMNCPYCYVKDKVGKELSTLDWYHIMYDLNKSGVFQVTFGGGEPTMREDLFQLAHYAKLLGLTLCMTSNGINIPDLPDEGLQMFDQINISWHGNFEVVKKALAKLEQAHVRYGINYNYSRVYVKDLPKVKELSKQYNAEILFLTYKAIDFDFKNQINPSTVLNVAKKTSREGIAVAIDGATCNKCMAAKRFCDIDSLGNVMVCSFVRKPVGNLLKDSFNNIWSKRTQVISCPYIKHGRN